MYVVIAGAGLIGSDLARELVAKKHDVVIIDREKEVCDRLYAEMGVVAIHGAITNMAVLADARVDKADAAVAATGRDADNLTFAVLAKSLGVPQVVVRMRDPAYESAFRVAGVGHIVRVTDLMVNQMIVEIEQPDIRRLTRIGGGKADIFMVDVPDGARVAGKTVREIASTQSFPSQCVIIAAYNRGTGEFVIPRGDQVIREGDELCLISSAGDIAAAADVITARDGG